MASKESFIIYEDWASFYFALPDDKKVDFMNAILSKGCGKEYEIQDAIVRAYFDGVVAPDMDSNKAHRQKFKDDQAEKGRKSGEARRNKANRSEPNEPKRTTVRKTNRSEPNEPIYVDGDVDVDGYVDGYVDGDVSPTEKEGLNATHLSPRKSAQGARGERWTDALERLLPDYDLPSVTEDKVREWMEYKAERREPYKPTGLKVFLGKVKRAANDYGDDRVCEILDNAMSSGYKGPVWSDLDRPNRSSPARADTLRGVTDWAKEVMT